MFKLSRWKFHKKQSYTGLLCLSSFFWKTAYPNPISSCICWDISPLTGRGKSFKYWNLAYSGAGESGLVLGARAAFWKWHKPEFSLLFRVWNVRLVAGFWCHRFLGIFSIYVNHAKPEIPNRYLRFTQLPRFEYITDFWPANIWVYCQVISNSIVLRTVSVRCFSKWVCSGKMKFISIIECPEIIKKILRHLGLWEKKARPPPKMRDL